MTAMMAREALRQYIEQLSDEEVRSLWDRIQCEEAYPPEPLTPEEIASIERGIADSEAGRVTPHDEVMLRLRSPR